MSKWLHLLRLSSVTVCAAACGFPRPPDISPDSGMTPPVMQFPASNSVTRADLESGIAPMVVPAGATFVIDTDQGSIFDAGNGNAPLRLAGPGVKDGVFYRSDDQDRAFFAIRSLMVSDGAIVRGVGTRALILVVDGAVEIHGVLDVSAGHCSSTTDGARCPGPGGAAAAAGCSPGQLGSFTTGAAGGGGGGGFASSGGAGGGATFNMSTPVAGGSGGSGTGCLGLDPLHGGSGGAGGTMRGGGGGGAVQVTSYMSIALVSPKIADTGGAWAGGAGGGGGQPGGSGPVGGGGGGAGGVILLEAPTIDIQPGAVLAANGGGGGAGALAIDGQPGQFGSTPASGGGRPSDATGGAGAALNANAMDGAPGVMTQQSSPAGGGGGGGIGRIHINAITSNVSDQAVLSPAPSITILPAS